MAPPDGIGTIAADVPRESASEKITVIGFVPGAAQFGHTSVWPEMRSRSCRR